MSEDADNDLSVHCCRSVWHNQNTIYTERRRRTDGLAGLGVSSLPALFRLDEPLRTDCRSGPSVEVAEIEGEVANMLSLQPEHLGKEGDYRASFLSILWILMCSTRRVTGTSRRIREQAGSFIFHFGEEGGRLAPLMRRSLMIGE